MGMLPRKDVMMAASGEYGKINILKVSTDEPVFILQAQNKLTEIPLSTMRQIGIISPMDQNSTK